MPTETKEMKFFHLTKYKKILVTGPQRSGTRIMAKMIARDTGYKYIDEDCFGVHNPRELIKFLLKDVAVIQCPALFHLVHAFVADDTLIVVAKRNIEDIVASQKRVKWNSWNKKEFKKYGEKDNHKKISVVKYKYWDSVQKPLVKNWLEVEYDSLSDHPMWIKKGKRAKFHTKQTEL